MTTICAKTAYTCTYVDCRTHVLVSHRPMTAAEAQEIIIRAFGSETAAGIA